VDLRVAVVADEDAAADAVGERHDWRVVAAAALDPHRASRVIVATGRWALG